MSTAGVNLPKTTFINLDKKLMLDFSKWYFDKNPTETKLDRKNIPTQAITEFVKSAGQTEEYLQSLTYQLLRHSIVKLRDSQGNIDYLAMASKNCYDEDAKAILGKGGLGVVKQAFSLTNDKAVALKVQKIVQTKPVVLASAEYESELTAEYMQFGARNHRITYKESGVPDKERFYQSMPIMNGGDYFDILRDKTKLFYFSNVPEQQMVIMLEQLIMFRNVCLEVAKLHNLGIVHGDLKPENIMYNKIGDDVNILQLIDFGFALRMSNKPYSIGNMQVKVGKVGTEPCLQLSMKNPQSGKSEPVGRGTPGYVDIITSDQRGGLAVSASEVYSGIYSYKTDVLALGAIAQQHVEGFMQTPQQMREFRNIWLRMTGQNPGTRISALDAAKEMHVFIMNVYNQDKKEFAKIDLNNILLQQIEAIDFAIQKKDARKTVLSAFADKDKVSDVAKKTKPAKADDTKPKNP